jgi:hypothetical protein
MTKQQLIDRLEALTIEASKGGLRDGDIIAALENVASAVRKIPSTKDCSLTTGATAPTEMEMNETKTGTYAIAERCVALYGPSPRPFNIVFFPPGYPKVSCRVIAHFKTEEGAKKRLGRLR